MRRILAIDPALLTGWCRGTKESYTSGCFKVVGGSLAERYQDFGDQIEVLGLTSTEIVYEEAFSKSRAQSQLWFGWQTMILLYCRRNGITASRVNPGTLKKWATGNGRAEKCEMVAAAQKYKRGPMTDDEADAILLFHYALDTEVAV